MWRAILAAAALLIVLWKKKLLPWCKKHLLPKRMRLLRDLTEWNSEHLCCQQKNGVQVRCFRSDSGNTFALGSRADEIYALAAKAAMLVQMFRERRLSRRAMPRLLRKDPLLDQIEDGFLSALDQYLCEMRMFQYDRVSDPGYGTDILLRARFLLENAEGLVQHYGDYMLALTRSAAMDTKGDRERIEAAVRGMQTAVAQTRNDVSFPMPAEQPQAAEQDAAQPEDAQSGMRMQ